MAINLALSYQSYKDVNVPLGYSIAQMIRDYNENALKHQGFNNLTSWNIDQINRRVRENY